MSYKIQEIKYLYTDGTKGLKHFSKLQKELVDLLKTNPSEFNRLLAEAKQIYNL